MPLPDRQLIGKWLFITLGSIATLAGVLTFWLPLPIGLPLLMLGVPLLARHSPHGRAWLTAIARRLVTLRQYLTRRRDAP
ncbi:MAG: hypothetical protein RLW61_06490 [Gammaproteobacteria bacterium]